MLARSEWCPVLRLLLEGRRSLVPEERRGSQLLSPSPICQLQDSA